MSGNFSSIVSQLIHQAFVASSAATARVNDLHCPHNLSILTFNMQMIQNRSIGCQCVQREIQFPAAIVDQLVHESWKTGIFRERGYHGDKAKEI